MGCPRQEVDVGVGSVNSTQHPALIRPYETPRLALYRSMIPAENEVSAAATATERVANVPGTVGAFVMATVAV